MIYQIRGDLKEQFSDLKVQFIVNSMNCHGIPSKKIAKKIAKKFKSSLLTSKDKEPFTFSETRLGKYILCSYIKKHNKPRGIVHLFDHLNEDSEIDYNALRSALFQFCSDAENQQKISKSLRTDAKWNDPKATQVRIGVPKFMSSKSEDDWNKVLEIIKEANVLYGLVDFYIIEENNYGEVHKNSERKTSEVTI